MNIVKHTLLVLSTSAVNAALLFGANAGEMPEEKSLSGLDVELVGRSDLYDYRALDSYSQSPALDKLVSEGKLPPVLERLPTEPLVMKTGAMVDGVGEYGGVFRHVIGGRPEGWNWMAGQHQGWGGINMAMQECLVRQGPRWQVKAEEQGALPNLAKSWEWNDDKTEVTMTLVEGIKWSDGNAFDTEDVAFWWNDNVQDRNVQSRLSADSFGGEGTKLEVIDPYTFKFIFTAPQSENIIEGLAYIQGCPGPSHILKASHPKYGGESYDAYTNVQPADVMPPVGLGAWIPVLHKPDELVVMRRNPYYFKVDESGQQLPYFNEMHFRLSTWGDRTVQTVAGTGDFSNMEDPGNYVEALKQSQSSESPVKAQFGPRVLGWRMDMNYNVAGAEDDYGKGLRELFRNTEFRLGLSHALNRDAIGQALARGPFAYPYTGGFVTGSPYYDRASTDYQEFDLAKANAMLDAADATDSDGNGIRNLPGGGADIEIDVQFLSNRNADRKQVDAITAQLAEVGVRLLPRGVDETNFDTIRAGGNYTAIFHRRPVVIPTRETCESLPAGDSCPYFNQSGDRMDFEQGIADAYATFVGTDDTAKKVAAANTMQSLITKNVYSLNTVQIPAAVLINKRVKNAHPGTPVFMYEWAEDSVIRERLWTPVAMQETELLPESVAQY